MVILGGFEEPNSKIFFRSPTFYRSLVIKYASKKNNYPAYQNISFPSTPRNVNS